MRRLLLPLLLACALPAGAAPSFEAVLARVGRGLTPAAGVLISREGLLVTPSAAVNPKGPTRVLLEGQELAGTPVPVPDLPDLALLQVAKPGGGEFQTLALGAASRLAPGARVLVVDPEGKALDIAVKDVEMDAASGAHYLRLDLPFTPALAGAPTCLPGDGRLVALVVADPRGSGCRALTVESLKEALFDAGRAVRPLVAAPSAQPGGLDPSRVRSWAFPFRSASEGQSVEVARSALQWRTVSGFQLPPLAPLRDLGGGTVALATYTGTMHAVVPEAERLLWSYGTPDLGAVLHPPAITPDHVFLSTGRLMVNTRTVQNSGGLVDFAVDLFGLRHETSLVLNHGSLQAVDARTGEFRWSFENRLLGEPQVVGALVCFGGLGVRGALDASSGRVRWLRADEGRPREADWYCLKAGRDGVLYGLVVPVKVEGHGTPDEPLALVGDGEIRALALEAATGRPLWETRLTETGRPTPLPMATSVLVDADGTICALFGHEVFVLGPGGELRTSFGVGSTTFPDRIALSRGVLFLAGEDGPVQALRSSDGRPAWSFPMPGAKVGSPLVHDGVVYQGTREGVLYALDERTGSLVWQVKLDRSLSGGPLVRDGLLYCASEEGRIWSLRLPSR